MRVVPPQNIIDERFEIITVGYFSPEQGLIHLLVPSTIGDLHPHVIALHEHTHRDLTILSELGFFETLLGKLATFIIPPPREAVRTRKILENIVANSWIVHESAAVFCSLILAFANCPEKLSDYLGSLPDSYRSAFNVYHRLLGVPVIGEENEAESWALVEIARTISQAALDVPILMTFESYARVSEASVATFLKQENPDYRQEQILTKLVKKGTLTELTEVAKSFLKQQISKVSQDPRTKLRILTQLDEVIMNKLHEQIPEIIALRSASERYQQQKKVFANWQREWISRGYKRANLLQLTPLNGPSLDMIGVMESMVVEIIPVLQEIPFLTPRFSSLRPESVSKHVKALRDIDSDLIVCILYNPTEKPVEITSNVILEAGHCGFLSLPWKWHSNASMIGDIWKVASEEALTRPSFASCPIEQVQDLINAYASPNIVWVSLLEMEEMVLSTDKKLPTIEGMRFVCATSSTVKQFLRKCERLAKDDNLKVWFTVFEQATFAVAFSVNTATFYVFPITYATTALIFEALTQIKGIAFVYEGDELQSEKDVLADLLALFYGASPQLQETF